MLNITKTYTHLYDEYHSISHELTKYSQFRIKPQVLSSLDYDFQDIILISDPNMSYTDCCINIPKECRKRGIKIIGQYSKESNNIYQNVDLIITVSPQLYTYAKSKYKNIPVIFLPESINTLYYENNQREVNRFKVGINKYDNFLAEKLKYPVFYMNENINQDTMKAFYSELNVFIFNSFTDGNPRAVLEAMASGLPVISTEIGNIHLLIPDEYIVPINPEKDYIEIINQKLDNLYKDYALRDGIGRVNRVWCEKMWSWENNIGLWDEVFYYLKENKIDKIIEISDYCIGSFKKYFEPNQYVNHIKKFSNEKIELNPLAKFSNQYENKIIKVLENLSTFLGEYWIANTSCKDIIKYNKIISNQLYLGVKDETNKQNLINFIKKIDTKGLDIKILIEPNVLKIKKSLLYQRNIFIPMPVIPYLKENFGYNWRNK